MYIIQLKQPFKTKGHKMTNEELQLKIKKEIEEMIKVVDNNITKYQSGWGKDTKIKICYNEKKKVVYCKYQIKNILPIPYEDDLLASLMGMKDQLQKPNSDLLKRYIPALEAEIKKRETKEKKAKAEKAKLRAEKKLRNQQLKNKEKQLLSLLTPDERKLWQDPSTDTQTRLQLMNKITAAKELEEKLLTFFN